MLVLYAQARMLWIVFAIDLSVVKGGTHDTNLNMSFDGEDLRRDRCAEISK